MNKCGDLKGNISIIELQNKLRQRVNNRTRFVSRSTDLNRGAEPWHVADVNKGLSHCFFCTTLAVDLPYPVESCSLAHPSNG